MAFNVMDMFGASALNRLLQPIQSAQGVQSFLANPRGATQGVPPLPPPVDVKQYNVAGIAPEATGSVVPGAIAPNTDPVPTAAKKKPFLDDDKKQALANMFAGWAMGATPMQSLSMGAANVAINRHDQKNKNETVKWLQARGLDEASAKQIAGSPTVLADYLKQNFGSGAKNRNLINAGGGSIYNADTGEWITPPTGASRPTEYGLQPVYGQDENGNTVAFQVSKDGSLKKIDLPGGFSFTPGIASTDLGTSVIVRNNKTGQIIDTREKDVRGTASQTAAGKASGEAQAAIPAAEMTANMVQQQINELKSDPYLPNMVGPINSRLPNVTGDAARVQGRMNQLQGGAFLQARQMLKGGGAITDYEGARAEDAYARLQAAQSFDDYQKALDDFNEAVQIGLRKLYRQAGQPVPEGAVPSAPSDGVVDYQTYFGGQ
jgi:hypothetical protein